MNLFYAFLVPDPQGPIISGANRRGKQQSRVFLRQSQTVFLYVPARKDSMDNSIGWGQMLSTTH
jgi:hypothetical protein